jgi:chondroitin AC lyase
MKKLLCILLLITGGLQKTKAQANGYSVILDRYKSFLLAADRSPLDSVKLWMNGLTPDNQWSDINYNSPLPGMWPTIQHLNRVRQLAINWADAKSPYYHQDAIWNAISRAATHWLIKRYQNPNWWQNQIGVPQYWRDIIVLTRSKLSKEQLKGALEILEQYQLKGTGANLVWSADLALHDAALTQNEELLKKSSTLIANEIRVSTGDGIQPDNSYHQHGARLQTYHYGGSFTKDNIRLAWQLQGTPWAFPQHKIDVITSFVLNGWQWMARGVTTVPGTIDRAIARRGFLRNADLQKYLPYLIQLNPGESKALNAMLKAQETNTQPLAGFRHYPYSDFSAYQQSAFSFFLKTISTRTEVAERINGENMKGRFMDFGDSYLIKTGTEYTDLMPVWDWTKLPGQTNFTGADSITRKPFGGGVTNGDYGAAAMEVSSANAQGRFSAAKFWACYKNVMVCLVADAALNNGNAQIYTALNQSRWQGAVTVNRPGNVLKQGKQQLNNVQWMHHAGFVYIPAAPANIDLLLDTVSGKWSAINASESKAVVTEKVFMPVIYQQNNSSLAYAVAYAQTPGDAQSIAAKPIWRVVSNTKACQAVLFDKTVFMAAFTQPGRVNYGSSKKISVDGQCLLLFDKDKIYASDPLHKGGNLNITISGKRYHINLPKDGLTVSQKL